MTIRYSRRDVLNNWLSFGQPVELCEIVTQLFCLTEQLTHKKSVGFCGLRSFALLRVSIQGKFFGRCYRKPDTRIPVHGIPLRG
jgi:hypothetical protein